MVVHPVVACCTRTLLPCPLHTTTIEATFLPGIRPTFSSQAVFLTFAHVEVSGEDLHVRDIEVRPTAETFQLPLAMIAAGRSTA